MITVITILELGNGKICIHPRDYEKISNDEVLRVLKKAVVELENDGKSMA